MKVIVAGYFKTGTKTMQAALTELGYNVYDWIENFEFLEKEWKQICTVGGSTELFRKMYENVDAVTDQPGCIFWDEILKAFPDAKIILTMRENEEEWWRSVQKQLKENSTWTLWAIMNVSPTGRRLSQHTKRLVNSAVGQQNNFTTFMNETLFKMAYSRHNAHVLQNAPKGQLLVFNLKDGWDPLCDFLDLPVPSTSFPHKNKKGEMIQNVLKTNKMFRKMQREVMVVTAVSGVIVAIGLYMGMAIALRGNLL
ncbi:uncharacterized protein LOC100178838 [Ciona intestinalis]